MHTHSNTKEHTQTHNTNTPISAGDVFGHPRAAGRLPHAGQRATPCEPPAGSPAPPASKRHLVSRRRPASPCRPASGHLAGRGRRAAMHLVSRRRPAFPRRPASPAWRCPRALLWKSAVLVAALLVKKKHYGRHGWWRRHTSNTKTNKEKIKEGHAYARLSAMAPHSGGVMQNKKKQKKTKKKQGPGDVHEDAPPRFPAAAATAASHCRRRRRRRFLPPPPPLPAAAAPVLTGGGGAAVVGRPAIPKVPTGHTSRTSWASSLQVKTPEHGGQARCL